MYVFHLLTDDHVNYFQSWFMMNNATITIHIHALSFYGYVLIKNHNNLSPFKISFFPIILNFIGMTKTHKK